MHLPPTTRRGTNKDTLHGMTIPDPYRWLEDGESPDVKRWTSAQNAYMSNDLRTKTFRGFTRELARDFAFTNFSNPYPVRGTYFWTERKPKQDQAVLFMKKGLNGKPQKLVDPNGKTKGNTTTLDFWAPSRDARYLAYGLSVAGDEMATLRIRDLKTKKDLKEAIPQCRYSQIEWLPDSSGFFYDRHPAKGTVPKNEEHLHAKVYFHALGTPAADDVLIFGKGRPKDDMFGLALSHDGTLLAISAANNWVQNELYIYDTVSKATYPLVKDIPAKFSLIFFKDSAVIHTNHNADTYRVLSAPITEIKKPIDMWKEMIPARAESLQSITPTKSGLIAEYLKDASSRVVIFDETGKEQSTLPLPPYSSLSGISAHEEEEEFFYGVDSFTFPKITYHAKSVSTKPRVYRATENPIDPKRYVVRQEWYTSKDGTRLPLFVYHAKKLTPGPRPTVLYGYGGFAVTNTPAFMRSFVPWITRGGVFVLTNLRGGGEFGEEWHKAGTKERKQNTFDDFISAAEYLITKKYTDPQHLGILGGSNGGLLVSAAITQRPDLFGAAVSKVPLTDMVRFPKFGMALRWVHEYGDPKIKEDLTHILTWSPYHNVHTDTEYPPTLFTTAVKDTRVDPLHARKMTAALQAVNKKNPIYLFTEMDAGHGPGRPVAKIVEGQALVLTFLAEKLELPF